jgi:RNA polymerase sigma factor for flagellar operon FliA
MRAVRAGEEMEEVMGAEGSIPVQVFQRLSKGGLISEVEISFDDLTLAMDATTGTIAAAFVPFTQERSAEARMLESAIATERDLLLMEHLPTVRYLARRIHERLPQHVELDDLVSAGVVGLIDAFSKFDHNKKVQFKSYAQFRIRGAILDSLRTLDWSPRELRRKGRAVEEAIRSVTQRVGRAPSEQEIAAEMELSLTDYQGLLGDLKGLEIGSLHMERSEDSGDEELAYIPGSPEEDPLFRCLKGEMKQRLADAIDELPEKERMVLTLYYYEELTMREIGLTLGVVESRVSQIHSSAVLRLRTALTGLRSDGLSGDAKVAVLKAKVSR